MFQVAELSKELVVFLMRTAGETVKAAVPEVGAINIRVDRSNLTLPDFQLFEFYGILLDWV